MPFAPASGAAAGGAAAVARSLALHARRAPSSEWRKCAGGNNEKEDVAVKGISMRGVLQLVAMKKIK